MDGILIIDKPEGLTSHDVVARLRRILGTRKIGHTGTLDPFATGVLVMLVGKATRLAQFLDKDQKEYDALVKFGYATDTGDRTGKRESKEEGYEPKQITPDDLIRVISGYMGEIEQVPPMYSAKKVAGKKLYEHARKGEEVERSPVPVTVYKLQISQDRMPEDPEPDTWHLRFSIICSAGTYIRTLAGDIGRDLGPGAHLAELRRVRAGRFDIASAKTLDEIEKLDDPASVLLPTAEAVAHLPTVTLNEERAEKTLSGLSSEYTGGDIDDGQAVSVCDEEGRLIAVGIYSATEKSVQPRVVIG